MKTIDDLLEYNSKNSGINEITELQPGINGTNFNLRFDKELLEEPLSTLEKMKEYQIMYNIVMGQTMDLLQKEYEKQTM